MSFIFPSAIDAIMRGELSLSGTVSAQLLSRAPTERMDSMDEITRRTVLATQPTELSVSEGKATCKDLVFPDVNGDRCAGVLFVADGKPLVFIDTGFPVTPIGTDVLVSFQDQVILRVK